MRGRTNIVARSTPIVNGNLKEFTVSTDGDIEIGDFVEVSYKLNYNFDLFENRLPKLAVKISNTNFYIIAYKTGTRTNDAISLKAEMFGKYAVGIYKFENYSLSLVSDVYATDLNFIENLFECEFGYYCLSGVAGTLNSTVQDSVTSIDNCSFRMILLKIDLSNLSIEFVDEYVDNVNFSACYNLSEKLYSSCAYYDNGRINFVYSYIKQAYSSGYKNDSYVKVTRLKMQNDKFIVDMTKSKIYNSQTADVGAGVYNLGCVPCVHYMFPISKEKVIFSLSRRPSTESTSYVIYQVEFSDDDIIYCDYIFGYTNSNTVYSPFLVDYKKEIWSDGRGNYLKGAKSSIISSPDLIATISAFTDSTPPPLHISDNNLIDVYSAATTVNNNAATNYPTKFQYFKFNPDTLQYISKSISLIDLKGNGIGKLNDYTGCFSACNIKDNTYFALINRGYYCFALSDEGIAEGYPGQHDMVKKYDGDGTCLGFTKEAGKPGDVIKVYVPKK